MLFCDDFDTVGLPSWDHYSQGDDGETVRVDGPREQGTGAVYSIKTRPGPSDPLFHDGLGSLTSGRLFVRFYMFVPSGFSFLGAQGATAASVIGESKGSLLGIGLGLSGSDITLHGPRGNLFVRDNYVLPRDTWLCVRYDFTISTNASARLRMNAETLGEVSDVNADTTLANGYDRIWLGFNYTPVEQTETVRMYIDDLIIDTADTPC